MAYDEELADRIRALLAEEPGLAETEMFGGLAFLLDGHLAIAASGQGGVLFRVDPATSGAVIASSDAEAAIMRGKPMAGWLRVGRGHLRTGPQLERWVGLATAYARSLPPKRP